MNGVSSFASPRNVKPYYSSRSPLPILPPMEHYKGRHSLDVDLLRWAENRSLRPVFTLHRMKCGRVS